MQVERRHPTGSLRGKGVLVDGERVVGAARVNLLFFEAASPDRDREVYGDGELLDGPPLGREHSLTLQLEDGRAVAFYAIPHGQTPRFDIVPPVTGR
jgi:hypothetical protein